MSTSHLHIYIGWIAMLLGVVSGGLIGLFFHAENWAGGYNSFRRRLFRLGHISFFGLGFVNLMFGMTLQFIDLPQTNISISSIGLVAGLVTMPLCCFLSGWKKPFRHLFPIPVACVLIGIISMLWGWSPS